MIFHIESSSHWKCLTLESFTLLVIYPILYLHCISTCLPLPRIHCIQPLAPVQVPERQVQVPTPWDAEEPAGPHRFNVKQKVGL